MKLQQQITELETYPEALKVSTFAWDDNFSNTKLLHSSKYLIFYKVIIDVCVFGYNVRTCVKGNTYV